MRKVSMLRVNPFVTAAHYAFYFSMPERSARRAINIDRAALGKPLLTFKDFFMLYGAFPDPKFRPIWNECEVPESLLRAK